MLLYFDLMFLSNLMMFLDINIFNNIDDDDDDVDGNSFV